MYTIEPPPGGYPNKPFPGHPHVRVDYKGYSCGACGTLLVCVAQGRRAPYYFADRGKGTLQDGPIAVLPPEHECLALVVHRLTHFNAAVVAKREAY